MRVGSLCTGYGGLDLAVAEVFGATTAWVSDIDRGANKVLAHRFGDVPNLGDFTGTDWFTVEPVDIITAGFPCQPVSHAGKRRGDNDDRWLWDDIARAVGAIRPRYVVLENVRGLLTARGGRLFGRVLGTLATLGYDVQWHGLRIPNGCHNRFRYFILATDTHHARRGEHRWPQPVGAKQPAVEYAGDPAGLVLLPTPAVNDMGAGKTPERWDEWTAAMQAKHGNGNGHGKSLSIEAQRPTWAKYAPALDRWADAIGRPPPPPTAEHNGEQHLSPAFAEWMMGLPAGWVTETPGLTRNEALKLLGNGVCPHQATAALSLILHRTEVPA